MGWFRVSPAHEPIEPRQNLTGRDLLIHQIVSPHFESQNALQNRALPRDDENGRAISPAYLTDRAHGRWIRQAGDKHNHIEGAQVHRFVVQNLVI